MHRQEVWSKLRANKVIGEFMKQDLQADLGMAVLGTTGISEIGKTLAKGCYKLEENKI